jgi:prepilin-type N-terminal cleavage/methylation domain-containing protein
MKKASILRNMLKGSKGLSLLETLIAIIILAIALTSISYFFSQARENIQTVGSMRCGLALAQDKMEQLKDLGYSHPDMSEGTHSDRVNDRGEADENGQFYRKWAVTAVDDPVDGTSTDDKDYKVVVLEVYGQWLNPRNETPDDPDKLVAELKTYISP